MIPVGVTQRIWQVREYPETRDALDVRWPAFLAACGALAVPLPNDPELAARLARSLGLHGLVLTGGENLGAYGGDAAARDKTESALLDWSAAEGVPVLAVCRGMQFVLHAYGGRLEEVDGHVATEHQVEFTAGSARLVNSYHRWAAKSVPRPLIATGWAGDVVESVRHESLPLWGLMWHPERVPGFAPEDIAEVTALFGSKGLT